MPEAPALVGTALFSRLSSAVFGQDVVAKRRLTNGAVETLRGRTQAGSLRCLLNETKELSIRPPRTNRAGLGPRLRHPARVGSYQNFLLPPGAIQKVWKHPASKKSYQRYRFATRPSRLSRWFIRQQETCGEGLDLKIVTAFDRV